MRLQHVRFQRPEPRWIISAYIGEGFLDLRCGRHRWRLHLT
jgi:hypothetical protein